MMTQEERDLAGVEQIIKASVVEREADRLIMKAMESAERDLDVQQKLEAEHEEEQAADKPAENPAPDDFPATQEGLVAFASSPAMQRLMGATPSAFRQAYIDFALSVVRAGAMTAVEFGVATKQIDQLLALPGDVLVKAVASSRPHPAPWKHERTVAGLQAFLKSDPMQTLKRQGMGDWTQCVLDFLTAIPGITPKQISEARLRLEGAHPDRPFVKGVGDLGNQLTSGQSVLMKNFGADLADPNRWMIPR